MIFLTFFSKNFIFIDDFLKISKNTQHRNLCDSNKLSVKCAVLKTGRTRRVFLENKKAIDKSLIKLFKNEKCLKIKKVKNEKKITFSD